MKKTDNEHPEAQNVKNICETTPGAKETKNVCDKVNANNSHANKTASSAHKDPSPVDDSANPGNKYISKNRKPKDLEKNGFNDQ